jgi:hypothetical protein
MTRFSVGLADFLRSRILVLWRDFPKLVPIYPFRVRKHPGCVFGGDEATYGSRMGVRHIA